MKLRLILLTAACACAATIASAQDITGADANGDGQVTRAEARSMRVALFDRIDANRDGFVSADERSTMGQGRGARGFERADANNDGRISRQEFMDQPMRGFDYFDADNNDVLSAEELERARAMAQRRRG